MVFFKFFFLPKKDNGKITGMDTRLKQTCRWKMITCRVQGVYLLQRWPVVN